jgi:hypothetical protein
MSVSRRLLTLRVNKCEHPAVADPTGDGLGVSGNRRGALGSFRLLIHDGFRNFR